MKVAGVAKFYCLSAGIFLASWTVSAQEMEVQLGEGILNEITTEELSKFPHDPNAPRPTVTLPDGRKGWLDYARSIPIPYDDLSLFPPNDIPSLVRGVSGASIQSTSFLNSEGRKIFHNVSAVLPDGTSISQEMLFGGFIQPEKNSGFMNKVALLEPFSNVLELSSDQCSEIKRLQHELVGKLKENSKDLKTTEELYKAFRETYSEFMVKLKELLLPSQVSALINYAFESTGPLEAIFHLLNGKVLQGKADIERVRKTASEQLTKIETTVLKLKKEVAQEILKLLSDEDRKAVEKALGGSLEDKIVEASLEDLQKQLELVKNGGVPKIYTLRDFAEKLKEKFRSNNKPENK